MCAALYGVDIVYERVDVLIRSGVVSECHFNGNSLAFGVEVDYIVDERLFVCIDILNELAETGVGEESLSAGLAFCVELTHVGEMQSDA